MCFCPTSGFVLGQRCRIHLLPYSASRELSWASGFVKNTPAAKSAKLLQLCPTLCDPIDGRQPTRLPSPWDSPGKNTGVVAISFSNAWRWKEKVKSLSRAQLLVTPWTAAHQAAQSMGFSRQEYWSGVPLPSPKNTPGWTQIGVIHFIAVQLGSQCPMGVQSVSSLDSQPWKMDDLCSSRDRPLTTPHHPH